MPTTIAGRRRGGGDEGVWMGKGGVTGGVKDAIEPSLPLLSPSLLVNPPTREQSPVARL